MRQCLFDDDRERASQSCVTVSQDIVTFEVGRQNDQGITELGRIQGIQRYNNVFTEVADLEVVAEGLVEADTGGAAFGSRDVLDRSGRGQLGFGQADGLGSDNAGDTGIRAVRSV